MLHSKPTATAIRIAHEKPTPPEGAIGDVHSVAVRVYGWDGEDPLVEIATYALRTRQWCSTDGTGRILNPDHLEWWERLS